MDGNLYFTSRFSEMTMSSYKRGLISRTTYLGQTAMKTDSWVYDNNNSDNIWDEQICYQDSKNAEESELSTFRGSTCFFLLNSFCNRGLLKSTHV